MKDLTSREDLSLAVMHLISLEEHLIFSTIKTKNEIYLNILQEIRKIRIELMKKLVVNTEGELWCISKHLLSGTMRLIESSNKYLQNDKKFANKLLENAFDLYSLFWFLQSDKNATKKSGKKVKKAKR